MHATKSLTAIKAEPDTYVRDTLEKSSRNLANAREAIAEALEILNRRG